MSHTLTQLEQEIRNNLKKIRVRALRRLLIYYFGKGMSVTSRRAKYDYKLTLETVFLIEKYIQESLEYASKQHPELLMQAMERMTKKE